MIDLTYSISEREFMEAQTLWCPEALRKVPGRRALNAAYLIFGALLGWSIPQLPGWLQIALGASTVGVFVLARMRRRAVTRHQYAAKRDQFEDVRVQLDESGYRDEKPGCCGGWIAWKSVTGWKEGAGVFVLGQTLTFVTIPKAALSSEQQQELRNLLATQVV